MAHYDIGDLARLSAVFTDSTGAAIDPTLVKVVYHAPGAASNTTLVYGVDLAVVKDSVGHYHLDLSVTLAGRYDYRWYSTGTGQASEEGGFDVRSQVTA